MRKLLFFEKPGCITNGKQKKWLRESGIDFQARNLLVEPWTAPRLRDFFGDLPLSEWINKNAPAVSSGEFTLENLTESELIQAMIEQPLLIRRPLFELGSQRWCGFDPQTLESKLAMESVAAAETPDENCSHNNHEKACH